MRSHCRGSGASSYQLLSPRSRFLVSTSLDRADRESSLDRLLSLIDSHIFLGFILFEYLLFLTHCYQI